MDSKLYEETESRLKELFNKMKQGDIDVFVSLISEYSQYILCKSNGVCRDKDTAGDDERKSSVLEEIGYHKVYIDDDVWYYELISNTPARTPVYTGGMDELLAAYPMQNGAYSSTKSFYCSYLSSYKNIIVRDIRTNYVEEGNITKDLIAGAAIVVAAASVWAAPASLLAWLGLSASVVTLPFDARVSRATNARTYRYRYGETYDTTRVNAYVTCSSEWGYDYYTVTDQGSGYAWGLNAYPTPLAEIYPDSTIANNAAYSYNNALDIYGCWPW